MTFLGLNPSIVNLDFSQLGDSLMLTFRIILHEYLGHFSLSWIITDIDSFIFLLDSFISIGFSLTGFPVTAEISRAIPKWLLQSDLLGVRLISSMMSFKFR